jgi:predicted dehydrogenase
MGNAWLRAVGASHEVEYAAWVDVNEQVLREQAEAFGFDDSHCYTALTEALEREQADGIINVTPPQFHQEVSCSALDAGLHVLSEKPLAETMTAAEQIVESAERAGRVFMVAQNYRYRPFAKILKKLVASNLYGSPGQVQISFYKAPHFGGFREEMEQPLVVDMSIHHFDLMRHILGVDPISVMGRTWNPDWSWFKGDASAAFLLKFGSGVQVIYHGSWCTTGSETSWSGDWQIECADGVIICRNDVVYAAKKGEPLEEVPIEPMARTDQDYLLHEFYLAVTEGIAPATNGRDNLKSLGMVFGAVKAARTGQIIGL